MRVTKLLVVTASLVTPMFATAANYTVDPTHTYPNFTISHLGFSTLHGRFNDTKGKLSLDLEKGSGAIEISIDAASIDTGFKKRDDHLRSPDFFNVAEFPTITYKSTKVTFNGKDKATVDGTLTILGVAKPVSLDVSHIHCAVHPMNKKDVCGFNATTKIKRSDYGVKFGLPAVGDDVDIALEMEAVKD